MRVACARVGAGEGSVGRFARTSMLAPRAHCEDSVVLI